MDRARLNVPPPQRRLPVQRPAGDGLAGVPDLNGGTGTRRRRGSGSQRHEHPGVRASAAAYPSLTAEHQLRGGQQPATMRTRHSWLARLLRSAAGRAAGPVVMASAAIIPVAEARLACVITGGAVVALSHVFVQRQVQELERVTADTLEDEVCTMLVHTINLLEHLKRIDGGLFRASVLLVDSTRNVLVPAMCSHGFTDDDGTVEWAKGEGPPGLAWQLGRPIIAPPTTNGLALRVGAQQVPLAGSSGKRIASQPSHNGTTRTLSGTQLAFLDQVEMIVCYPITDLQHPNRVLGVLTLDDKLPPGPHLGDVLRTVEFLHDDIRRRLSTSHLPHGGA